MVRLTAGPVCGLSIASAEVRMPNVKGSVLRSRLDFVEKKFGAPVLERVLAALPPDERQILGRRLLPAQWYPFTLGESLENTILRVLGEDGRRTFLEMGRRSAEYNLEGVHKVFVHAGNPHGLLCRAPAIYKLYYDTGHRTYEMTGENTCSLITYDSESFSEADCLTIIGWHERAVELCSGRHAEVDHPRCRARGDAVCEYLISWNLEPITGET